MRGIVLTHGHEDHIGALPYILPRLDVPVYGTALTLGILRNKLREHRLLGSTRLTTVTPGDTVQLGAVAVEWIHTTHSVPDSCALALHTPLGVIVHSGDFKVDQSPVHGEPPDLARLARLGDAGVLLLLSDSTNAEVEGMTPSESSVGPALATLIGGAEGRVLVATFASNISRLQQVIRAAEDAGRHCLVIGRSMLNNVAGRPGARLPGGRPAAPSSRPVRPTGSPTATSASSAPAPRASRSPRSAGSPAASTRWSRCTPATPSC